MRLSRPMPRDTSCTLAPSFSHRSAISLIKVIFVAKNAFAAYLISSDERRLVNNKGDSLRNSGRYTARMTSRAHSTSLPTTMRSGRLKSPMAAPSRKNSGFDTTANSSCGLVSRMMRSTSSPVPTGTVDFVTTTVRGSMALASSSAAA